MPTHALPDRRLWLLVSPQLPVGGFSYSQGIEHAVSVGVLRNASTCADWIHGQLLHALPWVDGVLAARLHAAASVADSAAFAGWNDELIGWRDTAELRAQELAQGAALIRVVDSWGERCAAMNLARPTFAAGVASMAATWGLPVREAVAALLWVWCENAVLATSKLVPLGQSDAQRVLRTALDLLADAVDTAVACSDSDIGRTPPGLGLHSAHHEIQFARQYQS